MRWRPSVERQQLEVDMGFFGFLVLGLIAGAIARLIIPGKQRGGWFSTLLIGVIGAFLAGWVADTFLFTDEDAFGAGFFSLKSWIVAIIGALVLTIIWNLIRNRRKA
jgi:uncharacterized membrane protein YeaQ/YmgE (transglycosylase-associated protein family)